jgi:multidrug efflux pump subunit AcrA (membrane-fusion protein)
MSRALFRLEAIEYQRKRAWAGTTTTPPMAMWLLTAFLATSVAAAGIFLSLGTYAQKETVPGYLTPVSGVAKLMPDMPGTVTELYVADGDTVSTGQHLLLVRTERRGVQGQAVDASILEGLRAKRAAIADRIGAGSAPRNTAGHYRSQCLVLRSRRSPRRALWTQQAGDCRSPGRVEKRLPLRAGFTS